VHRYTTASIEVIATRLRPGCQHILVTVGACSNAIPQQERFWDAKPSLRFERVPRKDDLDRINSGVVNQFGADILAIDHTIWIRLISDNLALDSMTLAAWIAVFGHEFMILQHRPLLGRVNTLIFDRIIHVFFARIATRRYKARACSR
jgi:hypothetical protein